MSPLRFLFVAAALTACSTTVTPTPAADGGSDVPSVDLPATDLPATERPDLGDPGPDVQTTCTSTSQCGAGQECFGGPGCSAAWRCVPRLGRACAATLAAFCDCAGNTFMASATCPDRPYSAMGACGGPPPACPLPGGGMCPVGATCPAGDGCNTCSCGPSGMLACTERGCVDAGTDAGRDVLTDVPRFCTLPNGSRCPVGSVCPAGDGCNDCRCAEPLALACSARPCAADAGPTYPTCTSNTECHTGEECMGPDGCATPWTCRPASGRLCTDDIAAYCGCNGVTFYGSSTCPPGPFARRGACAGG